MLAFHGNQGTISPDMIECKRIIDEGETPYAGYTTKADIYSLGIIFWWLFAGEPPWNRKEMADDYVLANHVLHGEFKIPYGVKLSKEGLQFMLACCA